MTVFRPARHIANFSGSTIVICNVRACNHPNGLGENGTKRRHSFPLNIFAKHYLSQYSILPRCVLHTIVAEQNAQPGRDATAFRGLSAIRIVYFRREPWKLPFQDKTHCEFATVARKSLKPPRAALVLRRAFQECVFPRSTPLCEPAATCSPRTRHTRFSLFLGRFNASPFPGTLR